MSKFTYNERNLIKSIVAMFTIKRIPDYETIKEIQTQTNKTMTVRHLTRIKQQIKRDSYGWYKKLREGEYEYIHEFKERLNEIIDLQKKTYEIIDNSKGNPSIQLAAIAELHKLNITLSNYFDVAPSIGNASISETQTAKRFTQEDRDNIIV